MPIDAAHIAVTKPTIAMIIIVSGASANNVEFRAIKNIPAVTIVAAWINAETGVGPAIASGSHTESGSCADLPQHPINKHSVIQNVIEESKSVVVSLAKMLCNSSYCSVPK
jgi:hypothetical protein